MTREELLDTIRMSYEWAEVSSGPALDYDVRVTKVVFYHAALSQVISKPFEESEFQDMVIEVLEMKLDEAFGKLLPEEFEQVFRLSEELRVWEDRYIPSVRKAR